MTKYRWNTEKIRHNLDEYNKIIRVTNTDDDFLYYEQIAQNIFRYSTILEN